MDDEESVRAGERERIRSIMSHSAARGREGVARSMALDGEIPAEAAGAALVRLAREALSAPAPSAGLATDPSAAGLIGHGWDEVVAAQNRQLAAANGGRDHLTSGGADPRLDPAAIYAARNAPAEAALAGRGMPAAAATADHGWGDIAAGLNRQLKTRSS